MSLFIFDGPNKLIIGTYVLSASVVIDVQIDLYSDWKEWAALGNNSQYLQAFSTIGGEEIGPGTYVGSYYFLENGWKIRPIEGNHRLILDGNLYTRDGSSAVIPTLGSFNVMVETRNSNLSQGISSSGGSSASDVWNYDITNITTPGRAGKKLNDTLKRRDFLALK